MHHLQNIKTVEEHGGSGFKPRWESAAFVFLAP